VESGIDHLSFSLDAGSVESYKWLTQSPNYEQVCRNLELLIETRNKRGGKHLKITTHIIGLKEMAAEFKPFVKRWAPLVDNAYVRNYGNWAGREETLIYEPATTGNGIPHPYQLVSKPYIPLGARMACWALWTQLYIRWNGDVSFCGFDIEGKTSGLNISDKPILDVWNSQEFWRFRTTQLENDHSVLYCKACPDWAGMRSFIFEDGNRTITRSPFTEVYRLKDEKE
jgi:MoaA/NifB/PqqE/SkfB family radical SAM enzyme